MPDKPQMNPPEYASGNLRILSSSGRQVYILGVPYSSHDSLRRPLIHFLPLVPDS